jgi:hypothetical protein
MKISSKKSHSPKMIKNESIPNSGGKAGVKKKGGLDSFDSMSKKVSKDMSEGELLKQQEALQEHARFMQLKSTLLAVEHDMKKSIISNIRF